MSQNLVIMAAGTGGHVIPGLAVAREMQSRGWTVTWLGTTLPLPLPSTTKPTRTLSARTAASVVQTLPATFSMWPGTRRLPLASVMVPQGLSGFGLLGAALDRSRENM